MKQQREGIILTPPVSQRDHRRGTQTARVMLVEYGDFACSRSGEAYAVLKENWERLRPHLCWIFRHFPASAVNPQAQLAAEAAEAAGAQNKFWEMHDMLFTHQQALENRCLVEYAVTLGIDATRFLRDMAQRAYADWVRDDLQSGMRSGVQSIPAFFINGVYYDKPWDAETLLATIEEATGSQETGVDSTSRGRVRG